MKYGESTFDILYLLFAVISGCVMLRQAKNKTEKQMGLAALILGCGDAFHLVPRVLNYFVEADFTAALGDRQADYVHHYDCFLCTALSYLAEVLP